MLVFASTGYSSINLRKSSANNFLPRCVPTLKQERKISTVNLATCTVDLGQTFSQGF